MKFNLNSKKLIPQINAKFFICIFCIFFICSDFSFSQDSSAKEPVAEKTIVTILNALKTSNKKDKETKEDLILFEGAVKISVEKGSLKTIISADEITYNRKHEMLYAAGNVELEQTDKSGAVSNISAANVLFNTSTLEGIFDDGRIVQADTNAINMPSGSTLVVASDVFAKNGTGTVAFKKGELTFCNDKHPHWKIKASRIWLLSGNEFAFFNAVLFLDNIPVLYLPAFYYPKDELLFNPVFGYRNRTGFFVQTTTYLYGRKPLQPTTDSSLNNSDDDLAKYFNFIKPTKLMDQKLEGIVLHNLDTPYNGDTTNYLKFMADWYSNLGIGVGLDGVFKPIKIFTTLEGNMFLGFGNTIYETSVPNVYLPYDSNGNKNYQTSDFLGAKIPFRYKAGFKIGISEPFSLTLNLPIYSDPYFNYDYGDRSETMDWFSYLLNNPTSENSSTTEAQKKSAAEINSFTWDLSGNYSIKLPDSVRPYIDNASISSFSSSIAFGTKTISSSSSSTEEKFFFPSQITPIKLNGSFSGTIFSTDNKKKQKSFDNVNFPATLIAPDFIQEKIDEKEKESSENSKNETKKSNGYDFEKYGLANIEYSKPSISSISNDISYNLKYSFNPDFGTQFTYSPEGIKSGAEFKWDRIQSSYLYFKAPLKFNDSLSLKKDFFTMTNSLNFNPSYQTHPYLADETVPGGYTKANRESTKKSDFTASTFEIINTNSVSLKPFSYYPVFKNTGITYNNSLRLYRTKFVGDAENPEWDHLTVDFDDPDSVTTHSLNFNLDASELDGDFSQSLVFSSTLPPQQKRYYATLNLNFPFVNLTGEAGVRQKSKDDKTMIKDQLKQGMSISLFNNKLKLSESFNYDAEEMRADALKISLSGFGVQLAYTMKYTSTYDFSSDQGWAVTNDKKFVPYSASLAYSTPSKNFKFWKNRISIAPTLATSIVVDFIRPTNSYFIFTPGLSFKLNEFFELSFSASSRNDVLYRYFQSAMGYPGRIPGEENFFVDLFNSFRFDDEKLRKASGFKLKSLNFSIKHDLHDWDLKCDFKIEPRLITDSNGQKAYDFNPYFSISVVWRPMESIKTEILDEYGTWQLK